MKALWWNLQLGTAWLVVFFGWFLTLTIFFEGRALFLSAFGITFAVQVLYHFGEPRRIKQAASEQVPWWVWR